jgi:hypothetical protein
MQSQLRVRSALPSLAFAGLFLALSAAACKRSSEPKTPDQAVLSSIAALRDNDLTRLIEQHAPADLRASWASSWDEKRAEPHDAQVAKQFQAKMGELTADGAEQKLMAKIQPHLRQIEPQLGMFTQMFQQVAESRIEDDESMGDSEREAAQETMREVTRWIQRTNLADENLWRKSIAVVCETARELDCKRIEDFKALSFPALLEKGDVVLAGTKRLLDAWGVDVNGFLDTVQARTLRQEGDSATVRVSFELCGKRREVDSEMVRIDGRWVSKNWVERQAKRGNLHAGL